MSEKNEDIDIASITGPTNTFKEAKTGRIIELILATPNCVAVIRSPEGKIDKKFVFSIDQLRSKHHFMLGFGDCFSVKDIAGNKQRYKLAEKQTEKISKWYEEAYGQLGVKEENDIIDRLETFKNEMGVSDLLEFTECEYREDQPGYKSSKNKDSFFFIALAEDALYILHEPAEESHPVFPSPLKRIEYKDCSVAQGGGSTFLNLSFSLGAMLGTVFGHCSSAVCRLLTKDGELVMTGTKEHVHLLEKKLAK